MPDCDRTVARPGPTSADTLHRMLLTLQDDGVLYVYESVEEAVRDVEALDAEQTFRAVFEYTTGKRQSRVSFIACSQESFIDVF